MRRMMWCAVMLLATTAPSQAALITNGDFEQPIITSGTFALYPSIPGFTATTDFIELQSNGVLGAGNVTPSGNQYIELNANNAATVVSDAFATEVGRSYTVSFLYSARPGGLGTQTISVQFGDLLAVSDSRTDTGVVNFTTSSFTFVADSTSTQLTFAATNGGSVGNLIDAIDVTAGPPVPEPATLLVTGLMGAAGFGYIRRRLKGVPVAA